MRNFVLTCSSTADMPRAFFEERDIPFLCYHFAINGKDYADDLGKSIPIAEFYRKISDGAMPVTTQINVAQFYEFFDAMLADGKDVLHLELSSGISGTCGSALSAQKELARKYPERKLYVVDSLGASSGYGLLVDAVADLRDEGKSIDEVYAWVEKNKLRVHHWFFTTDLTHLRRGGRVSAASATLGSLLNICPVMNVSNEGKLIPRSKARGRKRAMAEVMRQMQQHATGGTGYSGRCFISNSAIYDEARLLADQVEATFPKLNGKVLINDIGTVIGAHTGPGTVALFFFGDERVD